MVTRREFLQTSVAVAAFSRFPDLAAAKYDLLIKGGRVLDPSRRLDRVADVAIRGGRIAAVDPSIAATDAADVIDARGKIVTPGLVDIHVHARTRDIAAFCASTGVTTCVDAGSTGVDNVSEAIAVAKSAPNRVRVLLNLARTGVTGEGELMNFANAADVPTAHRIVEQHRDTIVGMKVRLSRNVAGVHDLDAVRRAEEITLPFKLPVMLHIGDSIAPLTGILALLKPGDIVTHVYAPQNGILDANGRVLPQVREARKRGIVFDIGNGRSAHITWDVAERALQQDFPPDTISSDLTDQGRTDGVFDFPTVLSKFLLLGMPLDRVIACATMNAARAIPGFHELGTLKPGAVADMAVMDLKEGDFEFVDNYNTKRLGHRKLVAQAVIVSGKRV